LDTAFETNSPTIRRNLLYGFYRSPINRPENRPRLQTDIVERWLELGPGSEATTDQYIIGILGEEGASLFMDHVSIPEGVQNQQLLIEFIRAMDVTGIREISESEMVDKLLSHENPAVVTEMLERLKSAPDLSASSLEFIYRQFIRGERNPVIFLTGLELLQSNEMSVDPVREKIEFMERENPYLTNRILSIYLESGLDEQLLDKIRTYFNEGGVRGLHAAQVLSDAWVGMEENSGHSDEIRALVRNGAEEGDAGVVRGLNLLLADESLITASDIEWLTELYERSLSEGKSDKAGLLSEALESRFPEQLEAEELEPEASFRMPDWERLNALGERPYWHLETEKGDILIRLDPLSAPFTVSSIDSLTRAGAYDGVAFHRVVHNFVIQGGDVGRGDGFGGPGYTIPTEPSLKSFERGAVGIASSGTDTEGSQYFVMHQWAPHLDADYTLFGTVVRGMDVVDRIQVGDLVIAASISAR
jgi:cyclophilin family peptidyl-prolyl cis-trans isomerase